MTDQTFAAPEAAVSSTSERAGFWIRFAAYIVDAVILGIVLGVLAVALGSTGYAIGWLLGIAYFVYCEGSERGQTIGKAACAIQVRSASGGRLGYGRAFLRYVGTIVSTIPIYLGFFWMLWDGNKQTWHDKIAGSVVVPHGLH
jgi:uncharacterized RDD family membrane protein YckC